MPASYTAKIRQQRRDLAKMDFEQKKSTLEAKLATESKPEKQMQIRITLLEIEKELAKIRLAEKRRRKAARDRKAKKGLLGGLFS